MKTKQSIDKIPFRMNAAECKLSEAAYLKLNATLSNNKKLNPETTA